MISFWLYSRAFCSSFSQKCHCYFLCLHSQFFLAWVTHRDFGIGGQGYDRGWLASIYSILRCLKNKIALYLLRKVCQKCVFIKSIFFYWIWEGNNNLIQGGTRPIFWDETETEKKWMLIFWTRRDCLIFLCLRRDRDET